MYLDFKEGRAKGRPPSDILQEANLRVILRANGVAVVAAGDHLLPVIRGVGFDQVHWDKLAKHGTACTKQTKLMKYIV